MKIKWPWKCEQCYICKKKDLKVHLAYYWSPYHWYGYWYHEKCIKNVLCNIERHSRTQVNRALEIHRRIKNDRKINEEYEQKRNKQIEEAQLDLCKKHEAK